MKRSFYFILFLFFLLPVVIFAQGVTTGALNGTVVTSDGSKLPGVLITAVHVPTGTTFSAITRGIGTYYIPSVKAGGPYKITAALEGFKKEKRDKIVVKLGENKQVNFMLVLESVTETVTVEGISPIMSSSRTGASQNVLEDTIRDLPTISRSLDDFTRLSPQMVSNAETDGAFNAGGRSSRYNNVQIDGAQNNDLFGLGSTGTPGGQAEATVISLDAVQEFQVVLAPYDVRQGMFTGGGVNIITKSGTNTPHGSFYYWGRNQSLMGDGPSETPFNEFSEGVYGVTFGGPLIKNKLFFFLNADYTKKSVPEDYYIGGSGERDWGHQAEADRFISICNNYGYDPGGYGEQVNDRTSSKIFARFDWNINAKHRLTLRHSFSDSDYENLYRTSDRSFIFGNGGVVYLNKSNSTVLQLNSTLGTNTHNELMINYQTIRDKPNYMGEAFPRIAVDIPGATFYAGSEEYRHRNQLDQDLIEITDTLTIYKGKHTFVLGTHNEFFKFYNVYVQREFGKYEFDSLDDFEAGAPSYFDRYYSLTGDPNAPARFSVYQLGLYAGDEWAVSPKLKLTFGIRADVPLMPDDPPANPLVEQAFGIPTNQNAGGNVLWSPRFGFNFDPTGKQDLMFRGGVGIFSGRTPYVWISNQYSNTGTDLARYRVYGNPGFFVVDPFNQPDFPGGGPAPADINLIDANYKFPQVLKTNIAVDAKLPGGFTGTLEFVYSKSINEIRYRNINVEATGAAAFDGRPLFGTPGYSGYGGSYGNPNYVSDNFENVLLLSNTGEGFQYTLSAQVQKEWNDGSMFNASYTYGMAKDLFGGTSSRAVSNWKYNIVKGDPNNPELSYSAHDTRNRFFFTFSKKFRIFKNAPTTLAIVYDGRTGRRYSSRYYNDVNLDGQRNDSIYVPVSESELILTKGTWADLDQYIRDDPALEAHRGQILPRYASTDPFYHQLDLKLTQAIPMPFAKGHKLEVFLTVKNFLNILNKDWGVYRYILYDDAPLTFKGYDDATGLPMFEFWGKADEKDARFTINQILSRWQMLFGFTYRF
ncbi:MAG: TonB-dependent receptor [Candidatus Aminicenantes bacterium]|nr:TonB-dependent receptor [Candidatus Aminicenantes bacterium]